MGRLNGRVNARVNKLERFYGRGDAHADHQELFSSFKRALMEYLHQLGQIRAPGFQRAKKPEDRILPPEAELLWGPDESQWHIDELATQRAIDKERERGVAEDVLEDVERALRLWREEAAAEIKERRCGRGCTRRG
jgi:hypothetical protein